MIYFLITEFDFEKNNVAIEKYDTKKDSLTNLLYILATLCELTQIKKYENPYYSTEDKEIIYPFKRFGIKEGLTNLDNLSQLIDKKYYVGFFNKTLLLFPRELKHFD